MWMTEIMKCLFYSKLDLKEALNTCQNNKDGQNQSGSWISAFFARGTVTAAFAASAQKKHSVNKREKSKQIKKKKENPMT